MNEICVKFKVSSASADVSTLKRKIYEIANVLQVPSLDQSSDDQLVIKFSAQTLANKSLVLVNIKFKILKPFLWIPFSCFQILEKLFSKLNL